MNKSTNNKRTNVLAIILLGLLVVGYRVVFMSDADSFQAEENIAASQRVESILKSVESISFDTSILQDDKFKSLKSLEIPLITLPIGRKNPFSPF